MPSTDRRNVARASRTGMIDAYGRRPLCVHEANGRGLAAYAVRVAGLSWEDVEVMECRDVHLLAQVLMGSGYLAGADRRLLDMDVQSGDLPPFTRGSLRWAYVLGGLTLLTMLGFCGFLAEVVL